MSEEVEKIYEEFVEKGWTDGLPIIPPTESRIKRMLEFTDRKSDDSLGKVPPSDHVATIENVAVNAVMAGCKPEYFPVVVTEIEALLDRPNLRGCLATTGSVWPMGIANGPIAKEIGLYAGWGLFGTGPNHRANTTIGRTMTLVIQNVGKSLPGVSEKKPSWNMGRYGICIRENEEESPWDPLHVEKGFDKNTSTVAVYDETDLARAILTGMGRGSGIFDLDIRRRVKRMVDAHYNPPTGIHYDQNLYIMSPRAAQRYVDNGWTKQDIKQFFYENCRSNPQEWFKDSGYPEETINNIMKTMFAGSPLWMRQGVSVPMFTSPEHICIIVAGEGSIMTPSHHHSSFVSTHPVVMKPITFTDGTPVKSVYDFKRKK